MHKFTNEELQQIVGCKVLPNAADLVNAVDDTWISIYDSLPEANRTIEIRGYSPFTKVWTERFCHFTTLKKFLTFTCYHINGITHWRYQD